MPISLEKCMEKIPSRFALATVTTKRWEQLMHGARPMVETQHPQSMTAVFKEIETGKLVLNMAERMIEKLGVPIPAPPEPPEEPEPPEDEGEAA
ncbi:MAG: DNA-directed RNA polymerase subunit omega [Vicinamibacteria bacterium]